MLTKQGRRFGRPDGTPGKADSAAIYEGRTEATLTASAKAFRDAFVASYVIDFHAESALVRVGFTGSRAHAQTKVSQLLREPYVQNLLHKTIIDRRPEDVVTRQQVMSRMWEEANAPGNPGKVRVAALAHLASMLGMTKALDNSGEGVPVNVMLVPIQAPEEWEAAAKGAQLLLKERADG
jgi:Terminase small subunit